MPIEFNCPGCQTRLRVPDETQGQLAACPSCQRHVTIPGLGASSGTPFQSSNPSDAAGNPSPAPPPPPMPPITNYGTSRGSEFNPFSAPTADTRLPTEEYVLPAGGELIYRRTSVSELVNTFYTVITNNLGPLALLGLVTIGLSIGVSFVVWPLSFLGQSLMFQNRMLGMTVLLVGAFAGQVVGAVVACVPILFLLNLFRGAREPFRGAFHVGRYAARLIGAQLLVALPAVLMQSMSQGLGLKDGTMNDLGPATAIGLIVGGLFVAIAYVVVLIRLGLTMNFIVDRDQSIKEAFLSSWNFTGGNALSIFAANIITGILMVVATVVTCGIAMIIVVSAIHIQNTCAYFLVTSQPITPFKKL